MIGKAKKLAQRELRRPGIGSSRSRCVVHSADRGLHVEIVACIQRRTTRIPRLVFLFWGILPMAKPRFPLSTLCLFVAVVALTIALFLLTARHNAELRAQTEQFNAQRLRQTEDSNAQLMEQTARHNAQLVSQAREFEKERKHWLERASGEGSAR